MYLSVLAREELAKFTILKSRWAITRFTRLARIREDPIVEIVSSQ
jgi:hypothetical protein